MHAVALAGLIVELVASIEAGVLALTAAAQRAPGTPAQAQSAAGQPLREEGPQQH